MATSESKGQFFLQNESIRITNRIDSNRKLECPSVHIAERIRRKFALRNYTPNLA